MRLASLLFLILVFGTSMSPAQTVDPPGAWVGVESPVSTSLRGVHVVDTSVAWASGAKGSVLRSVDAGVTWTKIDVSGHDETDFRDVHAWDAQTALIMAAGSPPVLLRTSDGGQSWNEVFRHPDPTAFFDAIAFRDSEHGMAVADPIDGRLELFETKDAGVTWERLPADSRPLCPSNQHLYAASGTCLEPLADGGWMIAFGGKVEEGTANQAQVMKRSATGEWTTIPVPLQTGESAGIFSIAQFGERATVVVGGDYMIADGTDRSAAFSNDLGVSWSEPQSSVSGYRSCVRWFRHAGVDWLVCCGPSGCDVSSDGGQTWHPTSDDGYHAMSFDSTGTLGIATGSEGRLARWVPKP